MESGCLALPDLAGCSNAPRPNHILMCSVAAHPRRLQERVQQGSPAWCPSRVPKHGVFEAS